MGGESKTERGEKVPPARPSCECTLEHRGYIEEIARDPGPGQAVLYGTSRLFLERLGLDTLDDLPPLGQFVPGADVVEQLEQGLRPEEP